MKEFLETALFLAGSILLWGKIGGIVLGIGLILYICHHLIKRMSRIRTLRSYA